jgi:hypothetical protein
MGITAEQNQWFKGKHEVLDEYDDKHRALQSAIASRNFLNPPGFLFEASIGLEENSKKKLSILNYQIVAEAIERELKQTGHDYNIAYKNARIAFELDKQTLLTALQQEFADLDATQSLSEEEVSRQFVELDLRRIILITTKTAIGLEMEGLKQELIDIDRLTFDNEVLLMAEKVTTAEAKLTIIPYIEAIIAAQEKVLIAEEANIPYTEDLIDEKGLLIDKKEEILPYMAEKANAQIRLANKKEEVLPYIENKVNARIELVDKKEELLPYIEEEAAARIELAGKQKELLPYIEDKIDALTALIEKKEEVLPYMEEKALMRQQLAFKKEEVLPYMEDKASSLVELAAKEEELLPYIVDKAAKLILLAEAILAAILIEEQRIDVIVSKANLKMDAVDNTLDIIEAEKAIEALRSLLYAARHDLQITAIDRQISLTDLSSGNINEVSSERTQMMTILEGYKSAIASSIRSYRAMTAIETAEISAAADITSKLVHLIGS